LDGAARENGFLAGGLIGSAIMKRVCLVGDSHLAAIKSGWEIVGREYPEIEASFFGAPAEKSENIAFESGRLVPKTEQAARYFKLTSGGQEFMSPADYDLIVLVGFGFSLGPVIRGYRSFRTDSQRYREGDFQLVSSAYFDEIAAYQLGETFGARLQREIRAASNVDVRCCATPMCCVTALEEQEHYTANGKLQFAALRKATEWGDLESLAVAYESALSQLARGGVLALAQPEETREAFIFTSPEFSTAATKLGGSNTRNDGIHMNSRYGDLMLRRIFDMAGLHSATGESIPVETESLPMDAGTSA
jgi:hypothetical protein